MAVDPAFKKGDIITYGEGRGNYADGKGGFVDANPEDPNRGAGFNPEAIELPTDAERALYERYTQGSDKEQALALAEIGAIVGATEGPAFAQWLAKASGHQ